MSGLATRPKTWGWYDERWYDEVWYDEGWYDKSWYDEEIKVSLSIIEDKGINLRQVDLLIDI